MLADPQMVNFAFPGATTVSSQERKGSSAGYGLGGRSS